jgi:hypothetical protein
MYQLPWMSRAAIAPVHGGTKSRTLIEIEGIFGRRSVGIFFGLLEQLVEFSLEYLLMALVLVKRFLEHLATPRLFSFEFLNCGAKVLDGRGFLVFGITDDGLELGINLKCCFAARAAHLHQVSFSFGHNADLSRFRFGSGASRSLTLGSETAMNLHH